MKNLLSNMVLAATGLAILVAAGPALAAQAAPPVQTGKTCLNIRDITSSDPNKDGSAITFKLQNGKVYRNDLQGKCPGLRFNGFSWVIHGPEQVCDNQQSIRVIQSGEVCLLGKFTDITPPKKG